MPGPTGGPIGSDFGSADDIRRRVVADLTHGLVALETLHTVVDQLEAQIAITSELQRLRNILTSVEAIQLDEQGLGR